MHQRKHEGYCEIRGDQMGEKNNKNNKIIGWAAAWLGWKRVLNQEQIKTWLRFLPKLRTEAVQKCNICHITELLGLERT